MVMVDTKDEFLERGMNTIRSTLEEGVKRQILQPEQVESIMGRIVGITNLKDVEDCDLVIEAVCEVVGVKNELSQSTKRADRFVGLNLFDHPAKNRFLEIIPGPRTSAETLKREI